MSNEVQIIVSGDISRWRQATQAIVASARETNQKVAQSVGPATRAFAGLGAAVGAVTTAVSALGAALSVPAVLRATQTMDSLRAAFLGAAGSVEAAAREMEFADKLSDKLGLSLTQTARSWSRFMLAAEDSGLTLNETRKIFEGLATATTGIGLSAGEASAVFTMMERTMQRGSVLTAEFRRQVQLLPAGLALAAASMGVTTDRFLEMLRRGEILVDEFMPKFALALQEKFAEPAEMQSERVGAALSRVGDSWQKLLDRIGSGAMGQLLSRIINRIAGILGDEDFLAGITERSARRIAMLERILAPVGTVARAVYASLQLLARGFDLIGEGIARAVDFIWPPIQRLIDGLVSLAEAIGLFRQSAEALAGAKIGGAAGLLPGEEEEARKRPRVPEQVTDAVDKLRTQLTAVRTLSGSKAVIA